MVLLILLIHCEEEDEGDNGDDDGECVLGFGLWRGIARVEAGRRDEGETASRQLSSCCGWQLLPLPRIRGGIACDVCVVVCGCGCRVA